MLAGLKPKLEGGDDITPAIQIVVDEPTCGGDRTSNLVPCPQTYRGQHLDHLVRRQQFTTAERRSSQHSLNSAARSPMVVGESNQGSVHGQRGGHDSMIARARFYCYLLRFRTVFTVRDDWKAGAFCAPPGTR